MSNHEQQVSQSSIDSDEIRTEFDRAYLNDPEFKAGIDAAWYRYTDRCAQANAGCNQTIGGALGEYRHRYAQLVADHQSRQPEAEIGHT